MEKFKKLSREAMKSVIGALQAPNGGCQTHADCGTGYSCFKGMYGQDNYCVHDGRGEPLPTIPELDVPA